MSLSDLLLTPVTGPGGDVRIGGLSSDSRCVQPGDLFAALPGAQSHGGSFIALALERGAAAVLTDRDGLSIAFGEGQAVGVPVIVSDDPRRALSLAAARFYEGQPATVAAVTGTNGKTSVVHFTRQIWERLGKRAVGVGTLGIEGAFLAPLGHTTPDPLTLHRQLDSMQRQEITHVVMEASSHGLAQRRLDGVKLQAAGFASFSRDHLDYHGDMDRYFREKSGLFSRVLPGGGTAVINRLANRADDVIATARSRRQDILLVGRGGQDDARVTVGDLRILDQRFDPTGQDLRFSWQGRVHAARLGLIGGFQGENVLMAAGLAIACGSAPDAVIGSLGGLEAVPGRMQLAAVRGNGASVFVDYAHTPDAIASALKALRLHVNGRLVAILGAGGDRDRGKRRMMGKAAATHADAVIVTDDNPRSEDPATIRAAVLAGCPRAREIGDRAVAILEGVLALEPGDALLVAGKGHESGQIIGEDIHPFDDAEQASMAVAALEGRRV